MTVPVTVTSIDHNTYIEGLTPADFASPRTATVRR